MDKHQIVEIVTILSKVYPRHFELDKDTLESFMFALEGQSYEVVKENLRQYILENKHPPTIAELVKQDGPVYRRA